MAKSDTDSDVAGKATPDTTASSVSAEHAPAEVWDAVDELYALAPQDFIGRRSELAAQARQSGDKAAASQIAALRKPTVSAWTVNTLARTQPELVENLIGLGEQMRQAQRTLDGMQLRELSKQRRTLLDALAREAFRATDQQPSASVQEEVVATLSAALADPDTAEALRAGNLVRAAHADGFGIESWPELALVGTPPDSRRAPRPAARLDTAERQKAQPHKAKSRTEPDESLAETAADRAGAERAEQERAEQERAKQARAEQDRVEQERADQLRADRERAARRAEAERTSRTAQTKMVKAERSEQVRADRVEDLERQLTTARQSLDEARFALRRAKADLAEAERSLDELS